MSIILPAGTQAAWQLANWSGEAGEWDSVAINLLRAAADTRDMGVRNDLLTLVLVACERADQITGRPRVFRPDELAPG